MPTEIEYLMNPYLSKISHNPFKKEVLSEKQIILKLQEINNRLKKISVKVLKEYKNDFEYLSFHNSPS